MSSICILSFSKKYANTTVIIGPKLLAIDYKVNPKVLIAYNVDIEVAVPKKLLIISL